MKKFKRGVLFFTLFILTVSIMNSVALLSFAEKSSEADILAFRNGVLSKDISNGENEGFDKETPRVWNALVTSEIDMIRKRDFRVSRYSTITYFGTNPNFEENSQDDVDFTTGEGILYIKVESQNGTTRFHKLILKKKIIIAPHMPWELQPFFVKLNEDVAIGYDSVTSGKTIGTLKFGFYDKIPQDYEVSLLKEDELENNGKQYDNALFEYDKESDSIKVAEGVERLDKEHYVIKILIENFYFRKTIQEVEFSIPKTDNMDDMANEIVLSFDKPVIINKSADRAHALSFFKVEGLPPGVKLSQIFIEDKDVHLILSDCVPKGTEVKLTYLATLKEPRFYYESLDLAEMLLTKEAPIDSIELSGKLSSFSEEKVVFYDYPNEMNMIEIRMDSPLRSSHAATDILTDGFSIKVGDENVEIESVFLSRKSIFLRIAKQIRSVDEITITYDSEIVKGTENEIYSVNPIIIDEPKVVSITNLSWRNLQPKPKPDSPKPNPPANPLPQPPKPMEEEQQPSVSNNGGSARSSVRPDSSAPAKKEGAKKDEMKNEPKKDEMKTDSMSNVTSTDKVSTKLVIGQKTYTAMVNGQAIEKTMDVAPMVHQGRTVLPARMISELLGVDVKFDQKSKTANFMYGEAKVQLTLGQKFMLVNGEKVALTADILNKDGRILLPVTDIQKAFAKLGLTANVSWDAATKSVMIEK